MLNDRIENECDEFLQAALNTDEELDLDGVDSTCRQLLTKLQAAPGSDTLECKRPINVSYRNTRLADIEVSSLKQEADLRILGRHQERGDQARVVESH